MDFKILKEKILALLKKNQSPHDIALGVAIGVFICCLPLYGLHTVLVIIIAILVKNANKIAMLIGTSFSIPPTLPFITWAGYSIGKFIVRDNGVAIDWEAIKSLRPSLVLPEILKHYPTLFLGSAILGFVSAVFFYYMIFWLLELKRRRS